MNPKTEELLKRTFEFGIRVLTLLNKLPKLKVNDIITYQLGKSSTSIGANYEEAQAAESKVDFIHKVSIVLKETRESNYWLRVLSRIISEKSFSTDISELVKESFELKQIFSSIKIKSIDKKKNING